MDLIRAAQDYLKEGLMQDSYKKICLYIMAAFFTILIYFVVLYIVKPYIKRNKKEEIVKNILSDINGLELYKLEKEDLEKKFNDIYNLIDKRIEQEDLLLNQRINFLLLSETFIFLAYFQISSSLGSNNTDNLYELSLIICIIGIFVSLFLAPSIASAVDSIKYYQMIWKAFKLSIRKEANINTEKWDSVMDNFDTNVNSIEIKNKKILVPIWFRHDNAEFLGRYISLTNSLHWLFLVIWVFLGIFNFIPLVFTFFR